MLQEDKLNGGCGKESEISDMYSYLESILRMRCFRFVFSARLLGRAVQHTRLSVFSYVARLDIVFSRTLLVGSCLAR